MDAFHSLAPSSAVLLTLVGLVAGATILLHRTGTEEGNLKSRRPPMVSSWIPWWGSQWAVERDPDGFFEDAA
ncbi:hypothetical protein FRB90_005130, partial [Tulasnella sp. 427]